MTDECKHSWSYIETVEKNRGYESYHHLYVFYCVKCLQIKQVRK